MTISAHIGKVKATHDLVEVDLFGGCIRIVFLDPEGHPDFERRLTILQSEELAVVLLEAAKTLAAHFKERTSPPTDEDEDR